MTMTASAADDLSLPPLLTTSAGDEVTTPSEWQKTRRPELLEFPKPGKPLHTGHMGYHLRAGNHDLTEYDWDCFMDFADKHWEKGRQ